MGKIFFGIILVNLMSLAIIITIFDISFTRMDPHDPKVLLYEFLPIVLFSFFIAIISIKIYERIKYKIKNKITIIHFFALSELLLFSLFTILIIDTIKAKIIFMIIFLIFTLAGYIFALFSYKNGIYSDKDEI
jgi:hypothetical protein